MITLYNTLTRTAEPFTPLTPGHVKLYVCGPTVYDWAHLGHARCYLTWDFLVRFLQAMGLSVTYVRNITDVDDKILNRAALFKTTPEKLAQDNTDAFHADMARLNLLPPTQEPRATQFIAPMQRMITGLIEQGLAYATADGTVYFRSQQFPGYGKLSQKPLDDLQAGARVDVDPHKQDPLDFALWKGTPQDTYAWDSPWGRGRPGWHIECSAMVTEVLGPQIDIHAGGADLIFPHHENEIAQSEAFTHQAPFVKTWLHNGFVNVSGQKMSKSLANFTTVRDLLSVYDAQTIRYFIASHHYRMPVDFNDEALSGAQNRITKIYRKLKAALGEETLADAVTEARETLAMADLPAFTEALCDDLNTPRALAELNEALNTLAAGDRPALLRILKMWDVLGFADELPEATLPVDALNTLSSRYTGNGIAPNPKAQLEGLIARRQHAKTNKDWATADGIRNDLEGCGIRLMDRKDGTTEWELIP